MITNFDSLYPNEVPQIGTPCTICYISDSYPAIVIGVKGQKTIIVQQMDSKIVSGSAFDDTAVYEYSENPNNPTREFSLRKSGRWVEKGSSAKYGCVLSVGHARRRIDPHF